MSSNISERRPLLYRNPNRNDDLRYSRQLHSQPPTPSTPTTNYHITTSSRHQCRTRFACATILLSLVFERIAFYGLSGNLVLFLNLDPFRWESYHAVDVSLYFFGVCFVMSLIGGWLADTLLGRFKALLISFLIYLSGYVLMPLMAPNVMYSKTVQRNISHGNSSLLPDICKWGEKDEENVTDHNPFNERCAWLIYTALTVIGVGTGFVKASIAPFGSDQVAREGQQATLSFFNWFYWSINVGALVGLSVITYVQQQKTFFYGYLASVSCLGLSSLLFLAGRCCYHVRAPDGSVLTNIFRIIREAFRRKRLRAQHIRIQRTSSSNEAAAREVDEAEPLDAKISFLDYAKHRYGGIFHDALVEDVKKLKKIFAVFAVLIPYWLVYFQMETTFLVQGLHMRLSWNRNESSSDLMAIIRNNISNVDKPEFVVAWLSLFDVVMLILMLPLFDRVIYPWWERRRGMPVSISWRILLGMMFATAAMVVAGVVEHFRLRSFWPLPDMPCVNASVNQRIGNTVYHAADMFVMWQIPQYILLGLSEVFTSVAGLQFAVSVAPQSMKGIIMGLFYLFSGIGSFLGTAVIVSLSSSGTWFYSMDYGNINCRLPCNSSDDKVVKKSCHLDYYFYLLGAVEVAGALLFLLVARAFRLDEHHRHSRSYPNPQPSSPLGGGGAGAGAGGSGGGADEEDNTSSSMATSTLSSSGRRHRFLDPSRVHQLPGKNDPHSIQRYHPDEPAASS